jgi:hypothetical protein
MSESDQCLYDTALRRFRELRCDFKSLHRLKYAQYIVHIDAGWKNNPRGFFKYADMKRNENSYSSSMFLGKDCARDSQSIANLFAGFFQSVFVQDDWILYSDLPTPDDRHKMSAIKVYEDEVEYVFLDLDVNQRDPVRSESVGFGCQSSFDSRF